VPPPLALTVIFDGGGGLSIHNGKVDSIGLNVRVNPRLYIRCSKIEVLNCVRVNPC